MSIKSPDPRDVETGRRIRMQRIAKAMSQEALATRLGLTFQQVQKYEKGVNRVGSGRLQQIAEILNCPVISLLQDPGSDRDGEEISAMLGTAISMRALKAFTRIRDPEVKRHMVSMLERIADTQDQQAADGESE